ncbi:TrgA family protein [Paragemmobacter straminiformis]|uniref:TrgA family protein n=1 Tax=Paragemmobacter straminiformis TaxID=2045119 RepID=A0A842IFG7_9RHOB|nr:TrgA family protein [Gemmobacter straminiformis]MBC2837388.1 TrgA family protein [Gemmobacter straminiformis]
MPTAPKLFAALAFGLLGWVAAAVLAPTLPEGQQVGWLRECAFLAGLVCGWRFMGRETGRGFASAAGAGLGCAIGMVALVTVGAAIYEMLEAAVRRHYPGPFEALMGMVQFAYKYVLMMGYAPFLILLGVGGMLFGAMTEAVGRRWK